MQTYDFIWQPILGGLAFDRGQFETALRSLGATQRDHRTWDWKLSKGETVITALNDAGAVVGFDVRVPLSDRPDLLLEVLEKASAFAAISTLQFVDPQLGRSVTERDGAAVEESYERVARYAGAYVGVPAATTAAWANAEQTGLTTPTKVALAVLVFLAAMYFAYQMVTPELPPAPLP